MPLRLVFMISISAISAIYSIIHIYRLAVPSFRYTENLLILDPVFWCWTVVAWVSAYCLIKSYIKFREMQ